MKPARQETDSPLSIFASEPDRSRTLLRLAALGAVSSVLAVWLAAMMLSSVAVFGISAFVIPFYGLILMLLTVRLVSRADRWQVESAMQARRLMSRGRSSAPVSTAPLVQPDSFNYWHFMMRLEDEIQRSRRTGASVSVVIVKVRYPGAPTLAQAEQMSFDLAHLAANYFEPSILVSALSGFEYGFCLPNTGREAARSSVSALFNSLGDYWCDLGIATYPDDGSNAVGVISHARDQTVGRGAVA